MSSEYSSTGLVGGWLLSLTPPLPPFLHPIGHATAEGLSGRVLDSCRRLMARHKRTGLGLSHRPPCAPAPSAPAALVT